MLGPAKLEHTKALEKDTAARNVSHRAHSSSLALEAFRESLAGASL